LIRAERLADVSSSALIDPLNGKDRAVFDLIIPGVNQGGIPPVALGALIGRSGQVGMGHLLTPRQ